MLLGLGAVVLGLGVVIVVVVGVVGEAADVVVGGECCLPVAGLEDM